MGCTSSTPASNGSPANVTQLVASSSSAEPPHEHVAKQVHPAQDRNDSQSPGIPVGTSPASTAPQQPADDTTAYRKRRQGLGTEVVRDEIRRMAGTAPRTEAVRANSAAVSDSDDEDYETTVHAGPPDAVRVPPEDTDTICDSLSASFAFKGLDRELLRSTVSGMWRVNFRQGATILQQATAPEPGDVLYLLQAGSVDVVISGVTDAGGDEEKQILGNKTVLRKTSGWVFGDVALLFNSYRSASVLAATDVTCWAMGRTDFLNIVMKHSPGARAMRFVRKLPLLKGLSDNVLINVMQRMREVTYADGEKLIELGEEGSDLYLIRYGKVSVRVPHPEQGSLEVARMGRGQFVGERTIITGRLRSADCVAAGEVRAVVISKSDFLALDNPLLAWMLDFDAVATVLKGLPPLKGISSGQLEQTIECMERREETVAGDALLREGELMEKLVIIKSGSVSLHKGGQPVTDEAFTATFVREIGGYTLVGERCLTVIQASPVTVRVASEAASVLRLQRSALDPILGPAAGSLVMEAADTALLLKGLATSTLGRHLTREQLERAAGAASLKVLNKGDVLVAPSEKAHRVLLVKSGACVVVDGPASEAAAQGGGDDGPTPMRLEAGDMWGDDALCGQRPNKQSVVCAAAGTQILVLRSSNLQTALGLTLEQLLLQDPQEPPERPAFKSQVKFSDLEQFRVVGTGQFGTVRLVRDRTTSAVYALKIMHKAPIVEVKQIEHVINERSILVEAEHELTVKLCGAYQDKHSLYLLQEWVPGGELFHHLDLEGAFTDAKACFYAANVLLVMEHLHAKNIVYRDLKPENLLLDATGYIKMADFGFAKNIGSSKTYTICGTPDYQAPEVIMRRGTTKAADYWALGVLIFEMLVGDPPFKSISGDPWDTFRRTLSGRFYVPNFISDLAADIVYKLLQVNPDRRLGSGHRGAQEIRRHKWFQSIDWAKLEARAIPAPHVPVMKGVLDTSNFDTFDTDDAPPPANERDDAVTWDLWDWVEQ